MWRSQLLLEAIADGRPPNPEHIARMRARCRPFSDRRAGPLLSAVEFATCSSRGARLDDRVGAVVLPSRAYPGVLKSWHRGTDIRAARLLAENIGSRNRPGGGR